MWDGATWLVWFRRLIARGVGKDIFLLLIGGIIGLSGTLFAGSFEGLRKSKELEQVRLHEAMKREEDALQTEIASDITFLDDVFLTTEADRLKIEEAFTTMDFVFEYFNNNPVQKGKRPPRYKELLDVASRVNSDMREMRNRRQEKRPHIERTLEWRLGIGSVYDLQIASPIYLITINLEALALTQFSNHDGGPWHFSPVYLQKAPPEDYMADSFDKKREEAKNDIKEQLSRSGQRYIDFTKAASERLQEKKARLRSLRWGQNKPPY
jgi:hypothetical protein